MKNTSKACTALGQYSASPHQLYTGIQNGFLLCVSCPGYSGTIKFSAILFLLLVRLSLNSSRSFQRFRRTLRRNFNLIRQQMKNFPIDPIVKIARFRQRYKVAESGQFLQWGSMGNFFICCRIRLKFRPRVRLKQ